MLASAARYDCLPAPFVWVDIPQRLSKHPSMAKRIDQFALAFSVGPILCGVICVGTASTRGFEHGVDVVDSKHHLVGGPGHLFTLVKFAHDHLGRFTIDAELHAMCLTDADVLDQPEHRDVPRDRFAYIGDGSTGTTRAHGADRLAMRHGLTGASPRSMTQPTGRAWFVHRFDTPGARSVKTFRELIVARVPPILARDAPSDRPSGRVDLLCRYAAADSRPITC